MIIVPHEGDRAILDGMLRNGPNRVLRLFVGVVPVAVCRATKATDLKEASFPGYAPRVLVGGGWGEATTNEAGVTSATYSAVQRFTCSGGGQPETVRGFYVTDADGKTVMWCEAFPDGVPMSTRDSRIELTPYIEAS